MSTIRPLATITVLILVGVFLYVKITEKEPELPSEIAEWSMPDELDIGMPPESPSFDNSAPAQSSSSYAPPSNYSEPPPAFVPTSPSAGVPSAPSLELEAPKFSAPAQPDSASEELEVPDLPPLPTFPAGDTPSTPQNSQAPTAPVMESPVAESSPKPPETPTGTATSKAPPLSTAPPASPPQQGSLYSTTRLTVQAALDRGELSQGLLLLTDWYGDPSLTPQETQEVDKLLSQLAGSVIYSREHRLAPPYMVQAGENLRGIAAKYEVPWQLLAKINGLSDPDNLQAGQELKVVQGPFSAMIDLSERRLTLMLDRRYAGQFPIEVDPTTSVEEGHWLVNQKLLTPVSVGLSSNSPTTPTESRSIMLNSVNSGSSQIVMIRGGNSTGPTAAEPTGRVIRMKSPDVDDVYDILSLGSRITIRR